MQSDGLCQVEHVKVGCNLSGPDGIAFANQNYGSTCFIAVNVWLSGYAELASVMHHVPCHRSQACCKFLLPSSFHPFLY